MPQAQKIKPSLQLNLLPYLKNALRYALWLVFNGIALYLLLALLSFDPKDAAWTHTQATAPISNLGGLWGAWFADVTLYCFGYMAYLIPFGIALWGWNALRDEWTPLNLEMILWRALGLVVALGSGCCLAALHLPPGVTGSAGGITGVVLTPAVFNLFGIQGGQIFLVALFLAGLTLSVDLPWLSLVDGIGKFVLWILDIPFQLVRSEEEEAARRAKIISTTPNSPLPPTSSRVPSDDAPSTEPPSDVAFAKPPTPSVARRIPDAASFTATPFTAQESVWLDQPASVHTAAAQPADSVVPAFTKTVPAKQDSAPHRTKRKTRIEPTIGDVGTIHPTSASDTLPSLRDRPTGSDPASSDRTPLSALPSSEPPYPDPTPAIPDDLMTLGLPRDTVRRIEKTFLEAGFLVEVRAITPHPHLIRIDIEPTHPLRFDDLKILHQTLIDRLGVADLQFNRMPHNLVFSVDIPRRLPTATPP